MFFGERDGLTVHATCIVSTQEFAQLHTHTNYESQWTADRKADFASLVCMQRIVLPPPGLKKESP